MEKCVTIAAACNRYWRRKHLPLDLIAVEPSSGWRGARMNHSKASLEWLMWQEYNTGSRIQHARNGGEYRIPISPTLPRTSWMVTMHRPVQSTNFTGASIMVVVPVTPNKFRSVPMG